MSVVPINARTAAKLAELNAAQQTEYVTFQPAARHALTALKARVSELDRMFAASATPKAMADRIEQLVADIQTEALRVRRFTR